MAFSLRQLRIPGWKLLWLLPALAAPLLAGELARTGAEPAWSGFFPDQAVKTQSTRFAVDSNGGNHVAYSEVDTDGNFQASVFYGYCLANCTAETNWAFTSVPHSAGAPDEVSLALDGVKPRILVRGRKQSPADPNLLVHPYHYLQCDAGCTAAAGWSDSGAVAASDLSDPFHSDRSQSYFVLFNGQPRFFYRNAYTFDDPDPKPPVGLFLAYCDTSCTAVANWSRQFVTPVNNNLAEYASLAISDTGQPRFVLEQTGADFFDHIFYFECADATCSTPSAGRDLGRTGSASGWRLRLDAEGRPRLAFKQGESGDPNDNLLQYLWCDADCASTGAWRRYAIPDVPRANLDALQPDLVLAGSAVYISYHRATPNADGSATFIPFLAVCTANCEQVAGAVWVHQQADTQAGMEAEFPVPAPPGCTINFWYSGYRSSLALGPDGRPRLGHDAVRLAGLPHGVICQETWRAARISSLFHNYDSGCYQWGQSVVRDAVILAAAGIQSPK